jgi:hypothetical protein
MSAKALFTCSFELAAESAVATGHPTPESLAAEIQFREDLWREYRREAVNAGFNAARATEYASALSLEMGPVVGASGMAPIRGNWFYQSRVRLVRRTITSGLIQPKRWEKGKPPRQTGAAGASILARAFRWWNRGGKS